MPISPTVLASIHYIGLPVVGNPAYLSSLLLPFSPFDLGQRAAILPVAPMCHVLGYRDVILDPSLS